MIQTDIVSILKLIERPEISCNNYKSWIYHILEKLYPGGEKHFILFQ